MIQHSAVLENA